MKKVVLFTLLTFLVSLPVLLIGETQPMLPDDYYTGDLMGPELPVVLGSDLNIDEVTRIAAAKSLNIQIERLDMKQKKRDVSISKSVFDTHLNINANYSQDHQERTSVVLGNREIEGDVSVELKKKIFTGTTIGVKGETHRDSTTSAFTSLDRNYTGLLEFSFNQPLLKNFFGAIDRKKVKQVKLNVKKFSFENLDRIEEEVLQIRSKYWDLLFAHVNLENRHKDLRRAQEFLKITEDKLDRGLNEKTDRFAAESNVRQRVIQVWRALTDYHSASYALKVMLNTPEVDLIVPVTQPKFEPVEYDIKYEQRRALEKRRDLKAFQLELMRQQIEVEIRGSELLPDLEFDGRIGSTGLDRKLSASQGKPFSFGHRQYYAGVTFSMPLENRSARGRYYQGKIDKKRFEKQLQYLRLQIGQEVHDKVRSLTLAGERVRQTQEIRKLESAKLEEETKNFNLGRSDSKTIIDFQEDVIHAETEQILALTDYAKALDQYYRATNTLFEWVGLSEDTIQLPNQPKVNYA